MNYSEITINGQQIKLIPVGDCACGCGGKTSIATRNRPQYRHVVGRHYKFLGGHGATGNQKGALHPQWKGGRRLFMGYVEIYMPSHPRARKGYVFEHIVIMEKLLGRLIGTDEHTHHINGNRGDNAPGNLMLFGSQSAHHAYEARLKAFKECGHYDWRKCPYCHKYDSLANLSGNTRFIYHNSCANADHRRRYALKKPENQGKTQA